MVHPLTRAVSIRPWPRAHAAVCHFHHRPPSHGLAVVAFAVVPVMSLQQERAVWAAQVSLIGRALVCRCR